MPRELTQKPKNGFTILMVDDDEQILSTYVPILKSEGYEVLSTSKSSETLDIIKKNHIDILLQDYFMDEGTTAEKIIKSIREFNKDVIIILQTGYSGKIPALEMLNRLDIQSYFNKTDGVDKLLLTVTTAVKFLKQRNDMINK